MCKYCKHLQFKMEHLTTMEKLTLEQATHIVEELKKQRDVDMEDLHIDTDMLWERFIESVEYYTIEEARQIAKIVLNVNREGFWYA